MDFCSGIVSFVTSSIVAEAEYHHKMIQHSQHAITSGLFQVDSVKLQSSVHLIASTVSSKSMTPDVGFSSELIWGAGSSKGNT
ncbi:uncharacterized protein J8A68_004742 [[Candida] subhashii]|uniref:Uncharacterized protein n=1 Tax=[Candida] subhashii TaxID=561895 RepID=A0A8J5UJI6_9ASCO|nr:uncharacterized protein J8A68_004742 [[Candida] subhashii]KAG7661742.1 hypothetical protein J8A68_004742 [[Candida] subhashii]